MAKKRGKKASAAGRRKAPARKRAARRSAGRKGGGAARRGASRTQAPRQRGMPPGMHTVTPQLVFRDAARAIDFYKQAFGAREVMRFPGPGGKIMHAELRIGDSVIFVNDENPQSPVVPASPNQKPTASIQLYVPDVDAVFQSAVSAGARAAMPPSDMFWGDRWGMVADPFGQVWGISTHVRDLSPEEMKKAGEEWMAKNMPQQSQPPPAY